MEEKFYKQIIELVNWLNDECPAVAPPLEPYTTLDLSHDFAKILRSKLDKIDTIQKSQHVCPDCGSETVSSEWYCNNCNTYGTY